ncbi:sigma 54-interacting transcriptional regulator [Haliangium sp. UPWRP_2]|uniref:sigma 54-interacting transcriptional regulator n=1 Tax=Haliangium sp. UPWRP_2 TaxID=1931276 RepID=UPI001304B488|nr:sigma 54-interacting transcriptional regulator [Haliangium sp. UPWRP_2]
MTSIPPAQPPPSSALSATLTMRPQGAADLSGAAQPATASFLVIEENSSALFELPQQGSVIIGRAPDATLRLEDQSASRHHARVDIGGGSALLYDLGSRNGTRINGERIDAAHTLRAGDIVTICNTALIFRRSEGAPGLRPIFGLAQLRQRLEDEIDRSLRYQRPVSLLCCHFQGRSSPGAISSGLQHELRVMDTAAWASDSDLLLLLPELTQPEAMQAAERLQQALAGSEVQIGVVSCPNDGLSVDPLIAAAISAAHSGQAQGRPITADDTARTLTVGDRRILLADPAMARLYDLIEKLATTDLPVLVHGETGVGKEIAAHTLHHRSGRREHPLVSLNCAALAENLIESELFGHERGAFSGAVTTKTGLLETAHRGTLFLDEIGELPLPLQAKLLRVLETQKLMRVGDTRERQIDVRIVAATNRDLQAEVTAGRFRKDLYFRLSTARILLPPLRERPRELPVLARALLSEACQKRGRALISIAPTTMSRLLSYRWPGNVRELRNMTEYLAATLEEDTLLPWHLDDLLVGSELTTPSGSAAAAPGQSTPHTFRPIDEELRELERKRMQEALLASGGVHVRAAELIAMPIRTFTAKLKLYGLSARGLPKKS